MRCTVGEDYILFLTFPVELAFSCMKSITIHIDMILLVDDVTKVDPIGSNFMCVFPATSQSIMPKL